MAFVPERNLIFFCGQAAFGGSDQAGLHQLQGEALQACH